MKAAGKSLMMTCCFGGSAQVWGLGFDNVNGSILRKASKGKLLVSGICAVFTRTATAAISIRVYSATTRAAVGS